MKHSINIGIIISAKAIRHTIYLIYDYCRKWINYYYCEFKWLIIIAYVNVFISKSTSKSARGILVVPAANLDGGFGDDVMLSAFVSQIKTNEIIDIFTDRIIRRDDYLGKYKNVAYLGGFIPGIYCIFTW